MTRPEQPPERGGPTITISVYATDAIARPKNRNADKPILAAAAGLAMLVATTVPLGDIQQPQASLSETLPATASKLTRTAKAEIPAVREPKMAVAQPVARATPKLAGNATAAQETPAAENELKTGGKRPQLAIETEQGSTNSATPDQGTAGPGSTTLPAAAPPPTRPRWSNPANLDTALPPLAASPLPTLRGAKTEQRPTTTHAPGEKTIHRRVRAADISKQEIPARTRGATAANASQGVTTTTTPWALPASTYPPIPPPGGWGGPLMITGPYGGASTPTGAWPHQQPTLKTNSGGLTIQNW
jgi:hypothetical protein